MAEAETAGAAEESLEKAKTTDMLAIPHMQPSCQKQGSLIAERLVPWYAEGLGFSLP